MARAKRTEADESRSSVLYSWVCTGGMFGSLFDCGQPLSFGHTGWRREPNTEKDGSGDSASGVSKRSSNEGTRKGVA